MMMMEGCRSWCRSPMSKHACAHITIESIQHLSQTVLEHLHEGCRLRILHSSADQLMRLNLYVFADLPEGESFTSVTVCQVLLLNFNSTTEKSERYLQETAEVRTLSAFSMFPTLATFFRKICTKTAPNPKLSLRAATLRYLYYSPTCYSCSDWPCFLSPTLCGTR